jgi:hypothetical protein
MTGFFLTELSYEVGILKLEFVHARILASDGSGRHDPTYEDK